MKLELKKKLQFVKAKLDQKLSEQGLVIRPGSLSNFLTRAPEPVQKLVSQAGLWVSDPYAMALGMSLHSWGPNSIAIEFQERPLTRTEGFNSIIVGAGERAILLMLQKLMPPGNLQVDFQQLNLQMLSRLESLKGVVLYLEWSSSEVENCIGKLMRGEVGELELISTISAADQRQMGQLTYHVCVKHQSYLT